MNLCTYAVYTYPKATDWHVDGDISIVEEPNVHTSVFVFQPGNRDSIVVNILVASYRVQLGQCTLQIACYSPGCVLKRPDVLFTATSQKQLSRDEQFSMPKEDCGSPAEDVVSLDTFLFLPCTHACRNKRGPLSRSHADPHEL